MRKDGKMRGDRLDYAAERIWSTPRASDGEKGGPNQSFGAGGVPLPAMASQWPTPNASPLTNDVTLMKSGDGRDKPNKLGWAAAEFQGHILSWPTIRAHEAGQYQYSRGDHSKPVPTLTGASMSWSTPSVADVTGGRMNRSGNRSDEALMKRQAQTVTLAASPIPVRSLRRGQEPHYGNPSRQPILAAFRRYRATTCSFMRAEMRGLIRMAIRAERAGLRRAHTRPSYRRSLNPRFVAWLMGWPDRWTQLALAQPASMSCACSATALFRWRQRMRSELSVLPLPADMAPIQPDLFGVSDDR